MTKNNEMIFVERETFEKNGKTYTWEQYLNTSLK